MNAILPWKPRRGLWLPGGQPRINPAHPAAAFLSSAIVFNSRTPVDLTGRLGVGSPIGGTSLPPQLAAGAIGSFVSFHASGGGSSVAAGVEMQGTLSGALSVIAVIMRAEDPFGSSYEAAPVIFATGPLAPLGNGILCYTGNNFSAPDKLKIGVTNGSSGGGANISSKWLDGIKQPSGQTTNAITNKQWYGLGIAFNSVTANQNLKFGMSSDFYRSFGGSGIALFLVYKGTLDDDMMAELTSDPGAALLWPDDDIWSTLVGVSAAGVTGTSDVTLGAVTGAFTGQTTNRGASAVTLGAITGAATGSLTIQGQSAVTLGDITGAFTGSLLMRGASDVTLDPVTGEFTGAFGTASEGASDVTLSPVTGDFTGTVGLAARGYARGRSRSWEDVWEDVPSELQPVVSLAEHYVDLPRVEDVVTEQLARYARLGARASLNRRMTLLEEVKRTIVAVVAKAAEDDDEDALIQLL